MEEFYRQGDREKQLKMKVSPFCDREKPALAKCQLGFIDYIAKPLFECLAQFNSNLKFCYDTVQSNREKWQKELDKKV